jgi:hypothetical protein
MSRAPAIFHVHLAFTADAGLRGRGPRLHIAPDRFVPVGRGFRGTGEALCRAGLQLDTRRTFPWDDFDHRPGVACVACARAWE